MTMSMAALIEAAQAQRRVKEAESAARIMHGIEIVEASKAADLADLKALLGEAADEMEIALLSHDVSGDGQVCSTRYRLKPLAWNGLVSFDIYRPWSGKLWRFIYEDQYVEVGVEPGQMWTQPRALNMLAALQEQYEQARDNRIAVALEWLGGNTSELTADDAREILMTLAPEREAEWGAALAAWQRRRDEREAAVAAYVQALGEWRSRYEQALAENRRVLAETQRLLDMEFTRYEIGLAVFYTDDDGRAYPARVNIWSLDNKAGKDGSWWVLDNGRLERRVLFNVLWVGEAVTETLMDAGDGPWRETIYVHEAGQSLYCTPWLAEAARRDIRRLMISLPAEPEPPEWVRDGLTAAERERIIEVTRGMAHVGIPF